MSSRSLAAARARRAGENAPPVSGNRPVTSIGSQAAFSQPIPPGMRYNIQPPIDNVRTAKSKQTPTQQTKQPPQKYQQFYDQQPQQNDNGLPFSKLSISDAIGLITLRLGRVEQWIIETNQEETSKPSGRGNISDIPDNHKVIDNSVLTSIINRLDSLEKNATNSHSSGEVKIQVEEVRNQLEEVKTQLEEVKTLTDMFKRMGDDVTNHTLQIAKNSEQVFRFNRDLVETKDILKSFMVKYDMFTQETSRNFADYELALSDLEKRLPVEEEKTEEILLENSEQEEEQEEEQITTNISDIDTDVENIIMSVDLKNMIKQELGSIS
jgi:hypothetical protein